MPLFNAFRRGSFNRFLEGAAKVANLPPSTPEAPSVQQAAPPAAPVPLAAGPGVTAAPSVSVGVLRGAANAVAANAKPQPVVPTAAPPASPAVAAAQPQVLPAARTSPSPLPGKGMMFFPTSRGPMGVFNPDHAEPFMEGNSLVNTDEKGVPLGQVMVPVEGQPRAQIGVMAGGQYDPNAGPAMPYRVKPTTTQDPYTPSYVSKGTQEIAAQMATKQAEGDAPRLAAGQRVIARMEAERSGMGQGVLAPRFRTGNPAMERYLYENVERQQQDDANARAIKLQSEVNKGVQAKQEAEERVEAIKAKGRVDAAETSGRWHFEAAKTTADRKEGIEKGKLALAKFRLELTQKRGEADAADEMVRSYAENRGRILGNPNMTDRERRDALDDLNSVYEDDIDTSTGKPKQRKAAPAAPAAPAGQPGSAGLQPWQNKRQPNG
jgi:hypothetical protein